jgi:hypothetical protein
MKDRISYVSFDDNAAKCSRCQNTNHLNFSQEMVPDCRVVRKPCTFIVRSLAFHLQGNLFARKTVMDYPIAEDRIYYVSFDDNAKECS